jgi:hypothetical protein
MAENAHPSIQICVFSIVLKKPTTHWRSVDPIFGAKNLDVFWVRPTGRSLTSAEIGALEHGKIINPADFGWRIFGIIETPMKHPSVGV